MLRDQPFSKLIEKVEKHNKQAENGQCSIYTGPVKGNPVE